MREKLRKLSVMSKDELIFRLLGKFYTVTEYVQYKLDTKDRSDECWMKRDWSGLDEGNQNRFFTECYGKKDRLALMQNYLDCQSWIDEAEEILTGKLTLLGCRVELASREQWHWDPLRRIAWPEVFYARVKNPDVSNPCDIKYVWEMNRHQYLIVIGKAYWMTGDERYAEKVRTIIEDWIAWNPYPLGVNWTSSLELAIRAISWIWAYYLTSASTHWTPYFQENFLRSLYEHGNHIERHLSFYFSPYNHLIGEAAALHIIGSLFPQIKSASRWESLGWKILADQVDKQFHPDGMSVEQASFYHHFTLGFYLQSVLLRMINGKKAPESVRARLEKALEFSMHLAKPDGAIPMIGDIDNARSLYFSSRHSWDFRGYLGIGAALYQRADFKHQCGGLPEEAAWLLSNDLFRSFMALKGAPPSETSKAFFDSGYFISRDSWNNASHYFCFDCGEIGAGLYNSEVPSAAHGHADALSFELSAYGRSFLVDGGFNSYFGELGWHKYFRLEDAHNTLRIDRHRQAQFCGRLTWTNVKKPQLLKWISNEDYCALAGRIHYSDRVYHDRVMVYWKKYFWFLCDMVKPNDLSANASTFLHFDPSAEVVFDDDLQMIIAYIGSIGIIVKFFGEANVSCRSGGKKQQDGWIAPGYGMKKPACKVQIDWNPMVHYGIFPMVILPWRNGYDAIRFGESPNTDEQPALFQSTFSNSAEEFSVRVQKNGIFRASNNQNIIEFNFM